jgi:hypothetical protein
MRLALVLAAAVALSGCGMFGGMRGNGGLPKPADPLLQSHVDDTYRGHIHSNDVSISPY